MARSLSRRSLVALGLGMALGPAAAAAAPSAGLRGERPAALPPAFEGQNLPALVPGILAETATVPEPAPPADLAPLAAAAVLMDAASGRVLWAKNPHLRRPVASVTKLMTMDLVLAALASGRLRWNDLVSAGEQAVHTGGARIWLELGENMTVRDLFYAVAVQSANDAAVALAEYVGGTEEHFVAMMNEEARALGMRDTLYTDPTGLDDRGGYSSAYDVALLARHLVAAHPEVLRFTATWEHRLRGDRLWLVNRNRLLVRLPGTDGLKTGYTARAGYCLAATARRGATRFVAVVLGAPTSAARFDEAAAMLQWAFANYVTVPVALRGRPLARLPVDGGTLPEVAVFPARDLGVTVPRGQEGGVTRRVRLPKLLAAPLRVGQPVGVVTAALDGRPVAELSLVVERAVPRAGPAWLWWRLFARMWPWLQA